MKENSYCILCSEPAEYEETDNGNRLVIKCDGFCPPYEISLRASKVLQAEPHRKKRMIEVIQFITQADPNEMPVIRMRYQQLIVTTRNLERSVHN